MRLATLVTLLLFVFAGAALADKEKGVDDYGNRTVDVDYYQIYLEPGTYAFGTDASTTADPDMGDSYIHLYGTDCATQLGFDDDSGPGSYSLLNYTITTAGTYYVKVRGYSSSYSGAYRFWVGTASGAFVTETEPNDSCPGNALLLNDVVEPGYIVDPPPPPIENDTCAEAIVIEPCTAGTIAGTILGAVNDYDPGVGTPPPSCTGFAAAGPDVVYAVTVVAGTSIHLVYNSNAYDSSIYIVSDCANVNDSCLAGADDYPNPPGEVIDYTFAAAGTYYIICDKYGSGGGNSFGLDYALTCPAASAACCFLDGTCSVLTEEACLAANGTWMTEITCDPTPCPQPPTGACCVVGAACQVTTLDACTALGGDYLGNDIPCVPDPCTGSPTERTSWGKIKNNYR